MPALIKQQQPDMATNPAAALKVTKVRRTRQPRNPQLSVARRNERERNRVKMVNNGFALLRKHLPIEDLLACEQSGGETPTPDGAGPKSKAKKISKVQTLRAACQRIRALHEVIRSVDPHFEFASLAGAGSQLAAYDEEPLSVGEPLSCGSSNSNSTYSQQQQQQLSQTQLSMHHPQSLYASPNQFVKLEPQSAAGGAQNLPSPQHSQGAHANQQQQQQQPQHQPQQQYQRPAEVHQQSHLTSSAAAHRPEQTSHTQLWIQQHQNSFIEQQQQYQLNWYEAQQHQQSNGTWQYVQQQAGHESPDRSSVISSNQPPPAQLQPESPVWFNSSSPASTQSNSQPISFNQHHQQQHQISLYSQ